MRHGRRGERGLLEHGWALTLLLVACFMAVIIFSPSLINYWLGNSYLLYLKLDEKPKTHVPALTQARVERIMVRGVTKIDVYEVGAGGKEWESPKGRTLMGNSGVVSVYTSGDSLIEVTWLTKGVDGIWVSGGGKEVNKEGVTIENEVPVWTDQAERFLNETRK